MSRKTACLIISALGIFLFFGCQDEKSYKDNRIMMGTFIEVDSSDPAAAGVVFSEFERIDNLLSKYKPDSEVSQLNRIKKLKVSPETFEIINKAKEFYRASDGAFDITVGPLIDLWGFTDGRFREPARQEIENCLKLVGADKIILRKSEKVVELSLPGIKVDLGGIAKGYAIDCVVRKLKALGIKNCMINAGGQVYCLGHKSGKPWKIAVQDPRAMTTKGTLELVDAGVSTSGDYEQFFTRGNRSFSHIMNPKTGYPADSGIISVSVVSPSATTADALSTAIFVLGEEKGRLLAAKFPGTVVTIIKSDNI